MIRYCCHDKNITCHPAFQRDRYKEMGQGNAKDLTVLMDANRVDRGSWTVWALPTLGGDSDVIHTGDDF